jgi:hypothetical protein
MDVQLMMYATKTVHLQVKKGLMYKVSGRIMNEKGFGIMVNNMLAEIKILYRKNYLQSKTIYAN